MVRKSIKSNNNNGFTMIEVLFSLAVCILIVMNVASIVSIVRSKNLMVVNQSNIEIGVKQISQSLYTAKIKSLGTSIVYTNENDEEFNISLNNGRIVKSPGFDIYVHKVNKIYFYEESKKIYLDIETAKHKYTFLIGTNYHKEVNLDDKKS